MQSKLIAAAAIASSATAIKLEAAPTTILVDQEKGAGLECHGAYAYQCI